MLDQRVKYVLSLLIAAVPVFSQEMKETPTNLDVIRSLAKQISVDAVRQTQMDTPGGNVDLSVVPKETAWYVESSVGEGLQSLGFVVRQDTAVPLAAEFGLSNARVEYSNVRKDGLFGSKVVDRKIEIQLTSKFTDRKTGSVLWASEKAQSVVDTIELSEINRVENPTIAITRGTLPRESFFSNFAEPLILLGAIAVAVFLLFNVRS